MDNNATSTNTSKSNGKLWFFITFMVLISALGSFVNDMFTPALPEMCTYFHTTIPTVQLGLTFGMLGLAVGQFLLGPVSDKYGRKPVLVGTMSVFVVAAVVSVFSPTIHFFLGCRLVQGLGASGCYFLGRSMPTDRFTGRELAKVMALIGGINGLSPAAAPVLGGITADHFSWKGIFVVLAAFSLLLLALSPLVKETLKPENRAKGSWGHIFSGYLVLLRNRKFMVHISLKGMGLGLLFAYISASPFILEKHYGLSETSYGLVIGFNALFVILSSMVALKFRPLKKASWAGAWIIAAGVAGQAIALNTIKSIVVFEVFMIAIVFGLGMLFTATNTISMNEGRERAGEASAMLGVTGYIVGAIVSPLVGMGNILHSTAIVFSVLAVLILVLAFFSSRMAPDLLSDAGNDTSDSQETAH